MEVAAALTKVAFKEKLYITCSATMTMMLTQFTIRWIVSCNDDDDANFLAFVACRYCIYIHIINSKINHKVYAHLSAIEYTFKG